MRRPVKNRKQPQPDEVYGSMKVAKLINYVMERGKKDTARKIVYKVMEELKKEGDALIVLEEALDKAAPNVEVRSRRVGGANYQIPFEVKGQRQNHLTTMWFVAAARSRKGMSMAYRIAAELMDAYNNQGAAVKKREDTHRMADANRAFAHFARG